LTISVQKKARDCPPARPATRLNELVCRQAGLPVGRQGSRAGAVRQPDKAVLAGTGTYSGRSV